MTAIDDSKEIPCVKECEFHTEIAASLQMGAVAEAVRMMEQGVVVIGKRDVLRSRKRDDLLVQAIDRRQVASILLVNWWDLSEQGLDVGGAREVDHAAQIGNRDRGIDAEQGVVGAAEDDDRAKVSPGNLVRESGKHLRGRLPVDAEVGARKRPALGDGVTHEGDARTGVIEEGQNKDEEKQDCGELEESAHEPLVYHRSMTLEDAQARARNIKVLIFDVDGVLTNGDIAMVPKLDGSGVEVKAFHAHDGLGISLARLGGIKTGIITKRQSATVAIRARDLKLEFIYQGQHFKMNAVLDILGKAQIELDQLAYVGDDIVDLPVMRMCGLAIATANARPQVKAEAHWVTPLPGGQGAGRDAIDFILSAQGSLERVIEEYLDESNPNATSADIGTGQM